MDYYRLHNFIIN